MEADQDGIHECCICHRQDEARWCFCRDKNAVYCSSECQRDGWPVHKEICLWNEAKIRLRVERHTRNVALSNLTWVNNIYLNAEFYTLSQRQHPISMEDDLCGIRQCCICHHWDEARWCFCRDQRAVYCSVECQREGWQVHKQDCTWYATKVKSRSQRYANIQNTTNQYSHQQALEFRHDRQPAPEVVKVLEENAARFTNAIGMQAPQLIQSLTVVSDNGYGHKVGEMASRALFMKALVVQKDHDRCVYRYRTKKRLKAMKIRHFLDARLL